VQDALEESCMVCGRSADSRLALLEAGDNTLVIPRPITINNGINIFICFQC